MGMVPLLRANVKGELFAACSSSPSPTYLVDPKTISQCGRKEVDKCISFARESKGRWRQPEREPFRAVAKDVHYAGIYHSSWMYPIDASRTPNLISFQGLDPDPAVLHSQR